MESAGPDSTLPGEGATESAESDSTLPAGDVKQRLKCVFSMFGFLCYCTAERKAMLDLY